MLVNSDSKQTNLRRTSVNCRNPDLYYSNNCGSVYGIQNKALQRKMILPLFTAICFYFIFESVTKKKICVKLL